MIFFRITYTPQARHALKRIPKKWQAKILQAIESLASYPFFGKKLHGDHEGEYSLRVWPYRVIYKIFKKEVMIIILDIGHRQGIY